MCLLVGQGSVIGALYFKFHTSKALHCTLYHAEHLVFSSKSNIPKQKVAHRVCPLVELKMHLNRQFSGLFMVHMPLCLHVLQHVTRPLCSLGGGGGQENHLFGYVPPGV